MQLMQALCPFALHIPKHLARDAYSALSRVRWKGGTAHVTRVGQRTLDQLLARESKRRCLWVVGDRGEDGTAQVVQQSLAAAPGESIAFDFSMHADKNFSLVLAALERALVDVASRVETAARKHRPVAELLQSSPATEIWKQSLKNLLRV